MISYNDLVLMSLGRMSIKERNLLQGYLKDFLEDENISVDDKNNLYKPIYDRYDEDIREIKKHVEHQILQQKAIICVAEGQINSIKRKLEEL